MDDLNSTSLVTGRTKDKSRADSNKLCLVWNEKCYYSKEQTRFYLPFLLRHSSCSPGCVTCLSCISSHLSVTGSDIKWTEINKVWILPLWMGWWSWCVVMLMLHLEANSFLLHPSVTPTAVHILCVHMWKTVRLLIGGMSVWAVLWCDLQSELGRRQNEDISFISH